MKALFLSEREIVPTGDRTFERNAEGWLIGDNGHLAYAGLTLPDGLAKLRPIVDQCDLIVIFLGEDGAKILDGLILSGFRWPSEKIVLVLGDAFPRHDSLLIESRIPGADCMLAEKDGEDGMNDYILNFLLKGLDPRSHMQTMLDYLLRRLDPFKRKYPR
jgi:hypothetical protein